MKKVILTIAAVLLVALGCLVFIKNGQKANQAAEAELVLENVVSTDGDSISIQKPLGEWP